MAKARRCEFCDSPLPKDARANQKFCDADCRRGRVRALPDPVEPDVELGPVLAATEEAIEQAKREKRIGVMDAGAIATIRVLARKIDEEQARWDYCFGWVERWAEWTRDVDGYDEPPPSPPKPPPMDNVSIPTYLKFCESLGLTPAGRGRIPGGTPKEAGGGGKLGNLTGSIPRPA
jgi:hypothetical protein